MIYGGFELSTPNIPTDSIFKIALPKLFEINPSLSAKLKNYDSDTTFLSSTSSANSTTGRMRHSSMTKTNTPTTPNMRGGTSTSESLRPRGEVKSGL